MEFPLRCVWTSQPDKAHSCRARVPARTVAAAWRSELNAGRGHAGFFHFVWRGRVWLAYGLPDGSVRGVYCPAHRAEREERLGYDPGLVCPDTTTDRAADPAGLRAAAAHPAGLRAADPAGLRAAAAHPAGLDAGRDVLAALRAG